MAVGQVCKILFLAVGGTLLIAQMVHAPARSSWAYRVSGVAAAVIAALSVWAYFEFGELHQYGPYGRHFYHYHEIYHYYVGAKYYPELGNTQLYDCTEVAWSELSREGIKVPMIRAIRSLEYPARSYSAMTVLARKTQPCHSRFSNARWGQFKGDLRAMLDLGWYNQWWETALFDLGFNPPPTWNLFGSTLAQVIPLTPVTMEWLPWIDIALLLGVAPFLIFRTFGLFPAFAYLIAFGNNWLSSYRWTGGSYFRQVWFFLLVAAICGLQCKRFRTAGVLFGLCAALRIFPLYFAIAATIPLGVAAWKSVDARRAAIAFGGAFAATLAVLVPCSLVVYGSAHWTEFLQKIVEHNHTYYVMHIGYEKFAVFSPDIGNQDFWYDAGLVRFHKWQEHLRAVYELRMPLHVSVQCGAVAFATLACARCTPVTAALIGGSCALFFFAIPANYYYVYLALFAVVFTTEPSESLSWLRQALLFAMLVAVPIMPLVSEDAIIQNGYINTMMFGLLLAFYASYLVGPVWKAVLQKTGALLPSPPPQ